MMKCGILLSNLHDWQIWIGHHSYDIHEGMMLEIKIKNEYYQACFGLDSNEWFIIIEQEITFYPRLFEVYKIRIDSMELNVF